MSAKEYSELKVDRTDSSSRKISNEIVIALAVLPSLYSIYWVCQHDDIE